MAAARPAAIGALPGDQGAPKGAQRPARGRARRSQGVLLPALVPEPAEPEPVPEPPVPLGRFDWERVVRDWPFDRRVTKLTKYVALTMATYADADGTNIRPGEPGLAAATGMGRSTVRRHVAVLADLGLVTCTRKGGGGSAAHYRLTVPAGYQLRSL